MKVARFRLLRPGLFIYHCAAAPLPVHIANGKSRDAHLRTLRHTGMYGMILVEPEEGLPQVDREFAVMQSEFYVDPPEPGDSSALAECSYTAGLQEQPELVVFNGLNP